MNERSPHDPKAWFSAARAASLAQLSQAMVNYLCREELVEPSCDCPRGHGRKRHYSFGDVVALRLVAKLSDAGVSPLRLKAALQQIKVVHPEITLRSLPASHLVTDGVDIYLRKPGEPMERLFDRQLAFAFVVELKQIRREVVQRLEGSKKTRAA